MIGFITAFLMLLLLPSNHVPFKTHRPLFQDPGIYLGLSFLLLLLLLLLPS
jgi:hypothetical protein